MAKDPSKDIEEWKKEKQFYASALNMLEFYIRVGEGKVGYDHSKTEHYGRSLNMSNSTTVHNSRYEALKSSGNIDIITNKDLMLTIMNYFQEAIPLIEAQRNRFNEENSRVMLAFKENAIYTKEGDYNLAELLKKSPVMFQIRMMKKSIVIVDNYTDIIRRTEKLISDIERETL